LDISLLCWRAGSDMAVGGYEHGSLTLLLRMNNMYRESSGMAVFTAGGLTGLDRIVVLLRIGISPQSRSWHAGDRPWVHLTGDSPWV